MNTQQSLSRTNEKYLVLPYQNSASMKEIIINDDGGNEMKFSSRISENAVDRWVYYPLLDCVRNKLSVESSDDCWLNAVYLTVDFDKRISQEALRPQIHYTPQTGCINKMTGLEYLKHKWYLSYLADPVSFEDNNPGIPTCLSSNDLVHWGIDETSEFEAHEKIQSSHWCGDVDDEISFLSPGGKYVIAKSIKNMFGQLSSSDFFSLPAVCNNNGELYPSPKLSNLRVWERRWTCEKINKMFRFEMRFSIGPDVWPEIKILDKTNTSTDIQTAACEIVLDLMVGQESEITIELCGAKWKWKSLTQTIHCADYELPLEAVNGHININLFCDKVLQELFVKGDKAMLITLPESSLETEYKIKSDLVENINNDSFNIQYYREPYIEITSPGTTATIADLKVYGLRPVQYSQENQDLLKKVEKGEILYSGESYTVYENCIEDQIYGDPPAWALDDGNTVLSPIRAVEEFQWRDTPWGDMTRIINRTEKWQASTNDSYPKLVTTYPVVAAAYKMSVDIMQKNLSHEFALPGQKGLMNAALFQGPGEGFGIWVRDACHSAFRIQNLLVPESIKKSLVYISSRGFNNGVDSAAMPALAIWDYYVATGDQSLLFETLPGIIKYAEEADSRFHNHIGLIDAKMSPAQDAFEEPENNGYCIGTEILFAEMYRSVANICNAVDVEPERRIVWEKRSEDMLKTIRKRYWNKNAECFSSGPNGSLAYQNGWWETTGAELSLWPRFKVADEEQIRLFLNTIKINPNALSDYGMNWYPFAKGKNHFWNSCWPSWTLGIAASAADVGDHDLLRTLIFQQVRNVVLNKTFHEVIDNDTGRAWRWPGLPWHAAAFIGYFVYGIFGIRYDQQGIHFKPAVPFEFRNIKLDEFKYRQAVYTIEIRGHGTDFLFELDNEPFDGQVNPDMKGSHVVTIIAKSDLALES